MSNKKFFYGQSIYACFVMHFTFFIFYLSIGSMHDEDDERKYVRRN